MRYQVVIDMYNMTNASEKARHELIIPALTESAAFDCAYHISKAIEQATGGEYCIWKITTRTYE